MSSAELLSSHELKTKLPCGDELHVRYTLGGDLHVAISVRAQSGALRFGVWQRVHNVLADSAARLKVKVTPKLLQVGDAEIGGLAEDVAVTIAAFFAQLPGLHLYDETRTPYRRMWTPVRTPASAV